MTIDIQIAGENALIVYFGEGLSDHVSQRIQSVAAGLSAWVGSLLIDMVPSYASLMVIFNPALTDHLRVRQLIREAAQDARVQGMQTPSRLITLPVYYGAQAAPDLARLAENAGLSCQQVIDLHSAMEYRVYAIGFAPGFAYLGEVDARIAAPRLATPRKKVPKGAVAIADRQTAVYPASSPGGWNLIGLCPQPMFDPNAEPTMPVQVGDKVRFAAIDIGRFLSLGGQLTNGAG